MRLSLRLKHSDSFLYQQQQYQKNEYQLLPAIVLVLLIIFCSDCRQAHAQPEDISTEELQALMVSGKDYTLINVLPTIIYDSMHLPGSINVPIGRLENLVDLPFTRDITLVFYCMGYL